MKSFLLLASVLLLSISCNWASDFPVVVNGRSDYAIVIPADPLPNETRAAQVLQKYIRLATSLSLPVTKENAWKDKPAFFVGKTEKAKKFNPSAIKGEGYLLASDDRDIVIYGGSGKGVVYGVYDFLELYMKANKYADEPGKVGEFKTFGLPVRLRHEFVPRMVYRQAYYPQSRDVEYLEWNKLHSFEDLWGIWGHSYFKLVDPRIYFKDHPEYYAMQNGKRHATQLCVSNDEVVTVAVNTLKQKMASNPDAVYWSISAEDDPVYCICNKCSAANQEEGTPTGAHLRFVNKIANQFPGKVFTTLAYTFTSKPPLKTRPSQNVYIMLSTIDAYRTQPLQTEPSAASFRRSLEGWERLTQNLFVWDYTTQFTNYLAPFPDIFVLGENIKYFAAHHVKGVFSQGSGDTYGEFAELKSYLVARLLWNPDLDPNALLEEFCKNYYRGAGRFIMEYITLIQAESHKTKRQIDIYGNPVNEYNTYLTPELIEQYSALFDQAEGAVEEYETHLKKIQRLRLSLEYTVLQQARFYGKEKQGYLVQDEETLNYVVKGTFPKRVKKFVETLKQFNITELSEGGLSPDQYQQEWDEIIARGWKHNYASEAVVTLHTPVVPEYPAKKERTLVDEVFGQEDFSYNWLCSYGTDMVATIDMGSAKEISSITMNFLDDPRHFIFLPKDIEVQVSEDGKSYTRVVPDAGNAKSAAAMEEHYETALVNYRFVLKPRQARYIKVSAKNWPGIPEWRFRPNRKPLIACDEVFVN